MTAPVALAPPVTFPRMILQLCRLDLRRFRVLIAVLVGLEVFRGIYVEWALHLAPLENIDVSDAGTTLLDSSLALIFIVATAIIVQADHPSDDRAFWRSRPIPGYALALAKLALFAALFVVLPAAINTVRLLAYGAPAASVFAAIVQLGLSASMAIPIWALAILTRTLPRFLLAGGGLAIGLVLVMNLVASLLLGGAGATGFGIEWAGIARPGWAGELALAAVGIALLVAHYWHRRTAVSVVAGLVLIAAPKFIPASPRTTPAPPALAALVAGRLSLDSGLTLPPQSSLDWARLSRARFPLTLEGYVALPPLPNDVSAGIALSEPRLTVAGHSIAGIGSQQCCRGLGVFGAASLAPTVATVRPASAFGFVPLDDIDRLREQHVGVRASATVTFVGHRLVAELPLQPGVAFRTDRYLVEIIGLDPQRAMVFLRVARFPRLIPGTEPQIAFFEADAARRRVSALSPAFRQQQPLEFGRDGEDWAQGDKWSGRFKLLIHRAGPAPMDPRLLIVESRLLGEARTTLSATDVPVHEARER